MVPNSFTFELSLAVEPVMICLDDFTNFFCLWINDDSTCILCVHLSNVFMGKIIWLCFCSSCMFQ